MLGVDRLDIIKGIPQKLLAFEKFLDENHEWRDKVLLVQIAVPTRTDVHDCMFYLHIVLWCLSACFFISFCSSFCGSRIIQVPTSKQFSLVSTTDLRSFETNYLCMEKIASLKTVSRLKYRKSLIYLYYFLSNKVFIQFTGF